VVAFNQSIAQFIAGWTALETSLGAISRLRQLQTDVKAEEKLESSFDYAPEEWPSKGRVEIRDLSAFYKWVSLIDLAFTLADTL
jgi:ATP-binding cassette subfamily C (CFTR/MRP) protein 1